jgi:23S rRNA pseudouridine1911/1915/1917 synthase
MRKNGDGNGDKNVSGSILEPNGDGAHFEVTREHHGKSLMNFLDAHGGPLDRRLVGAAARAGDLHLNGEPAGPSITLRTGDLITSSVSLAQLARAPKHDHLLVLHEDEHCLIASKQSGLPFDASRAGSGRSALERLTTLHTGEGRLRPGHRLDKDTSGLVITTRDQEGEHRLSAAFRSGEARVEYLAVIRRALRDDSGQFNLALGKRRKSDARMIADPKHGRPCTTQWHMEERLRGFSLLRLWATDTGRSHQIRAHLALAGHPVVCDRLYGEDDRLLLSQLKMDYRKKRGHPERPILYRPALHAARFRWGKLVVDAPLTEDLEVLMAQLHRHCIPTDPNQDIDSGIPGTAI